jgi:transcriptional regulator with XRE-family HTH domain
VQYFDPVQFGERVRKIREIRGMKQIDLAIQLGYTSERQIQRIESGDSSCSIDKLFELSQILDISTDYLLYGKVKESQQNINQELNNYLLSISPQEQSFCSTGFEVNF